MTTQFALSATGVNALHRRKTVPVYATPGAQLALGVLVEPIVAGQSFTYDLDVGQVGATALSATQLRAYFPAGLSVGSISGSGAQVAPGEVVWELAGVPVASALHHSVQLSVDAALPAATLQGSRAVLTYAGGLERDAAAEHALAVISEALPLSATFEATPAPLVLGSRVLYTTTITNGSARMLEGVRLMQRIPTGLQYAYSVDADTDAEGCGNAPNPLCTAAEEAAWTLGTLNAGVLKIVSVNAATSAPLIAGSLVTLTQQVTATGLGATLCLQKTVPVRN